MSTLIVDSVPANLWNKFLKNNCNNSKLILCISPQFLCLFLSLVYLLRTVLVINCQVYRPFVIPDRQLIAFHQYANILSHSHCIYFYLKASVRTKCVVGSPILTFDLIVGCSRRTCVRPNIFTYLLIYLSISARETRHETVIHCVLSNRGSLSRATPMADEECTDGDSGFCCQLCRSERESGLCTLFLARMVNTLLTGAALRSCTALPSSSFLSASPPRLASRYPPVGFYANRISPMCREDRIFFGIA